MFQDGKQNRFRRAATAIGAALMLPLMLLCLAGCGDIHGQANGEAGDHGSVEHIRLGFPF